MSNRLLLYLKILLPFLLNIPLFYIIYNKQDGTGYDLTNTFFYQGIINIIFGILIIYLFSNFKMLGNQGKYEVLLRANLKRVQAKESGDPVDLEGNPISIVNNRIKVLFIIIGIGLLISSFMSY